MRIIYCILKLVPKIILKYFVRWILILIYIFLPSRRKIAQNNVKNAIGGNYKSIVFKTYLYFADMITENIQHMNNRNFIKEHFVVEGIENYEIAKNLNKGVILTTAHFGNWEMAVCAFSILIESVYAMVRPLDNKSLDSIVRHVRISCGNNIVSSHNSAFHFLKLLKKGQTLGVLVDQASSENSMKIDFFNRPVRVSPSIAIFSRRLGTPIVPAYLKEIDGFSYKLIIEKPIVAEKSDNFEADVRDIMVRVYKHFEKWIKNEPYKYLWMHNRWK